MATVGGEAKRPAMAVADERAIDANNFRRSRWPPPTFTRVVIIGTKQRTHCVLMLNMGTARVDTHL